MAKQLNVDMRFTADTSNAKRAIEDLQKTLTQALSTSRSGPGGIALTADIEKARAAAVQLKAQLKDATNVDGSLNLSRFNESLKKSGQSLTSYGQSLAKLGPQGQQAFAQLASSISSANVQFTKSSGLIDQMWITLKNVARFQISSSIMHGLVGGVQTAYGYVQNLNESLNNIRIVTGQSTDQMAKFAEQANKAAKNLNSTTLDYTNASLIYYQQGLSDSEVQERTNVTLKMANVARESAETVSEQMTAIWNNFDDGSKSLEYYADVITALGAATASSSSEISAGLNKFAAVADTVGLSYENATAALATITATTRQSADTVGTGLRTLFSRLQGLSLGETLEDGVDLNKYSKALKTVGVDALDAEGNLRRMDDVLEDLGDRWGDLSKAQQTALAQTVGGVRQYTTLVALMDNWDFMKSNQQIATNASGTLQKQADIYAESWEAARDRIQASAESIYSALIDEDFFIGLDNFIAKNLDGISNLIKALGGLPGALTIVSSAFLTAFGPQISQGIDNTIHNLLTSMGVIDQQAIKLKQETNNVLRGLQLSKSGAANDAFMAANASQANISDAILQRQLTSNKELSNIEKEKLAILTQQHEMLANNTREYGQQLQKAQKIFETSQRQLRKEALNTQSFTRDDKWIKNAFSSFNNNAEISGIAILRDNIANLQQQADQAQQTLTDFLKSEGYDDSSIKWIVNLQNSLSSTEINIEEVRNKLYSLSMIKPFNLQDYDDQIGKLKDLSAEYASLSATANSISRLNFNIDTNKTAEENMKSLIKDAELLDSALNQLNNRGIAIDLGDSDIKIADLITSFQKGDISAEEFSKQLSSLSQTLRDGLDAAMSSNTKEAEGLFASLSHMLPPELQGELDSLKSKFFDLSNSEEAVVRETEALAQSEAEIKNLIATAQGSLESLGSVFTKFTSGLMSVASAYNSLKGVINIWQDSDASTIDKIMSSMTSLGMVVMALGRSYSALKGIKLEQIQADWESFKVSIVEMAARKAQNTATAEGVGGLAADTAATIADSGAKEVATVSTLKFVGALGSLLLPIAAVVAGIAALVAIIATCIKAYNHDKIAAENAAAAAEELGKKSEEAAQKAQEIVDVFGRYDKAVQVLSECEKGTQAWKDALQDVNNIVLDILATMPELISDMAISRDENGMFVIENTDDIIAQYQAKANNAKAAAVMANISANEASLQSIKTDRERDLLKLKLFSTTEEYYEPGAIAPSYRVALKAGVNNILDNAQDYLGLSIQEFGDLLLESGEFTKKNLFDEAGNATEALQTFYQSTMELGRGMESLQKQTDISAQVLAEMYLGDRYSAEAKQVAASEYQKNYDDIYAQVMAESNAYQQTDKQSDLLSRSDSIWNRYLKAIGESTLNYKLEKNAIQGDDTDREYVFTVGTDTKTQKVSAAQMAATIAAAEALEGLELSAKTVQASLSNVDKNIDSINPATEESDGDAGSSAKSYDSTDINQYLVTSNFDSSSQAAVEDILADIASFNQGDMTANTEEYLKAIFGEDVAKSINVEDFLTSLQDLDFDSVGDNLSKTVGNIFNENILGTDNFKNLSIIEQGSMADMLQTMFNGLGSDYTSEFAKAFGELDADQMKVLNQTLSDFDWATGDIADLWQSLKQVGITAEDIDLQPFIDYMVEASVIASTFDNATTIFKGIQDIINGIATGDTITDENYDALSEKYNISTSLLDSYFITMADGTHKLIGSAEEFQAAIKGATLKNFETNINQAQANNDYIRSLQNSGYSLEDLSKAATSRDQGQANEDLLAAQLNILQNTGYAAQGQEQANNLAEWKNHQGAWTQNELQAIADAVSQVSDSYENLNEVIAENEAIMIQNQEAIATTASTLQELSILGDQYNLGNEALQVGLQNLGTMYENASQELEAYRHALAGGQEEAINAAQANLEAAIKAGEAAAEYGLDVDVLEDLTDTFAEYNDKLSEGEGMLESDAEAAKDAAVRYMRLNNAVEDLADNYDTYETAIKNVQKAESKESKLLATTNKDYAAFKTTMADLLDTSEDLIDLDFVDSMNLDDLKKAAEGDEEAIGRLRDAFIEATAAAEGIDGSKILEELSGFEEGQAFTIDLDTMPFLTSLIQAKLAAGSTAPEIQEMLSGFGIDADVEPFNRSMAEMQAAAENAADGVIVAMDAAAGSGLDANVNTVTTSNADTKEDVAFEEQITWDPKESTGDQVVKDGDDEATPVTQQLSQARKVINWNPVSTTETTEQTAAAVEIKNAHKSSGGHTGGSSKKTGGGGGGGGSKSKKKDAAKADTGTRYHTVRAQQSRNSNKQSSTNRKKERAFGTERVKLIEKEVELQKEQLKLQETYLTEIKNNLKTDKKDLTDALNALGLKDANGKLTIEFDTDGIIKNYQRIEDALLARENALINEYNARQDDAKDEWFEDEKKKLDDLRELLSQYEETQSLYLDELDKMQEYIDDIADSLLELTEYKVELNLDVANDDLERIQFLLDQIDDNAYKAAEAISLFGEQTANSLDKIDIYQKGIEEILGHHGLSFADLKNKTPEDLAKAGLTADEISQIRDWRSAIVEANTELLEIRETIVDKVVDSFTELNDKVSESYNLFDHYNTVLEDYKNITDLMGRHMNIQQKELLKSLDNAMLKNATNTVTAAKDTFDKLTEARKEAQRAYDQAVASGDEAAMLQWQKVIDETDTALNEAQEEWLNAWQNAIEMVQDIFETAIDDTIAKFEASITGAFGSLDYMQEAYDRARDVDEEYLQDYDRLYELSKLQRDLNKVLNDTKGVANRKELLALQKELNQLQAEGTRLSQYDVDALRMKFELQQAYADLQGVGQAKNTVRLQRDHNGNWGYVYTADEDKVAEAEQEYEDKLHAYQQLNDEYINELQERALDIQSTYAETLRDIMTDTSLTKEQREARINELNSWFESEMAYIEQQAGNALGNQAALNERYLKAYNDTRAQMVDEWSETTLSFLEGTEQMDEYINKVMEAQQVLLKEAMDQLDERDKQIEKITEQAGTTVEALGDTIGEAVEDIGKKSDKTTEQVKELSKELLTEFKEALSAAVEWESEYQNKINDATNANNNFVTSINKMISALSELSALDKDDEIKMNNYYHELQERMEILQNAYSKWSIGEGTWAELEKAQKNFFDLVHKQSASIDEDVIQKFDTGGYTGEWGSGGKLAFLHEKEEIFNKHDTANLLSAAQILRTLDLQAFAMNFSMLSTPTVDNNNQIIEQDVHITAEFPNATNHTEIEEAFTNLANKAAQYANRKN